MKVQLYATVWTDVWINENEINKFSVLQVIDNMNFILTVSFIPHPPSFLTFLMSFFDIFNQILRRLVVITVAAADDDDDDDDDAITFIIFEHKTHCIYVQSEEK